MPSLPTSSRPFDYQARNYEAVRVAPGVTHLFGTSILTEAGLSFLELGIESPTPSWEGMPADQAAQFLRTSPWIIIFPGIALSASVLGFAFAGDGLRGILDPRQRGR